MKRRTSRVLAERITHRIIVTLKSGDAFAGVLWDADDRVWVLRNGEALNAGKDSTSLPLDGEVILMAAEILHAQKL